MKKAISVTLLALWLISGFTVQAVLSAEQTGQTKDEEATEIEWQQALKAQVALAKVKVNLLKALAELRLEKNSEAALQSLEDAKTNLRQAYGTADTVTRRRIADLEEQIKSTETALRTKSNKAYSELTELADKSESTLNAAIAETQTKTIALKKETSTRIALVQARAAALKAKIALEIEQSPEKAGQALEEAQGYLAKAKLSASKRTAEGIAQLELDAKAAKQAVTKDMNVAKDKTNTLVVHTEEQLQAYGKQVTESEEAVLLKKRYAELEARAALLKAQLAASADATRKQAQSYLDEAKAWYARAQSQAKETARLELQKMQKRIDDTKVVLKEGGKQASKKLSDLLKWAAERVEVKGEE
ncbi:MAG: hypothetical protein LWX01_09055 [Deltaproteobacteria bacterium]|nr:hypothetical protein [Deltaproteobacteria bacterium]MDL1961824.1 hypothetical protein [Deltaproteobacteria bacterium]